MFDFTALQTRFPEQFFLEEPLARYTVARLGGRADGLLRVKTVNDLCFAMRWAFEAGIPWLILGGGANVLASDSGFRGLIIVNHARDSQIDPQTGSVTAESGVSLSTLARMCMAQGLKNLEWGV
ncbi:MAG: FAD-binding protein, partial [Anaerolineae bacterium]|nr:FAD-binding protein [Anaerolineae bacterium]